MKLVASLAAATARALVGSGGGASDSPRIIRRAAASPAFPPVPAAQPTAVACPLRDDTNVVYSVATGVGAASRVWVEDFLWWWASANPDGALRYQALDEAGLQACALVQFPALKLFVNPGGNAYNQLAALGKIGVNNVREYVRRDTAPAAYAGFCAGAYMAAHDYIWESKYEGVDYLAFQLDPPFSFFPHTVEGSLVDLTDDQFGDQFGNPFRVVNVSNGHKMLYYGGSSFGYNGAPPVHEPTSPAYDPEVEVVLWYSDFYGHLSPNLPVRARARMCVLASVRACLRARSCVCVCACVHAHVRASLGLISCRVASRRVERWRCSVWNCSSPAQRLRSGQARACLHGLAHGHPPTARTHACSHARMRPRTHARTQARSPAPARAVPALGRARPTPARA